MNIQLTRVGVFRYAVILAIGFAALLIADYAGLFEGIDLYLYDLSFRIRGPLEHDRNIVIAAIDEKTLDRLGRWPIRREYYARLLDATRQAGAVGIDVIMAESSGDDASLREAMTRHGRVVLPAYIEGRMMVSYPAETLIPVATGHIHIEQGIDGVVRTVYHVLAYRDAVLPSFASVLSRMVTGVHEDLRAPASSGPESDGREPIRQSDPMHINFFGPPGTFQHIPAVDIVDGSVPPSFFRDKVVLVGVTSPGIEERMVTPFTQERDRMAGVEVHAHILNSMMARNAIRFVPDRARWAGAAATALLFFFLFVRLDAWRAMGVWLAGIFLISAFAFVAFKNSHVWVAPSIGFGALAFAFLAAYVARLEELGRMLAAANDEWDRTFNDISDAIIVHDCDFAVVRANKAADEIRHAGIFGEIAAKCRAYFLEGEGKSFPLRLPPEKSGPFSDELFDAERGRYFEIHTIPRLDKRHRVIGVIQIIRDVTERKRAEDAIKKSEEQLRHLTAHIQRATEMERTNIAREIHDELGQALTVLKIDLAWIRKRLQDDQAPLREKLDAMGKIIDRTIATMKRISTDLRPGLLDDLGLAAAIEWQTEEFQKRTGIQCSLAIEPKEISFDRERNTALFRIFQETLTNVARHAGATEVRIDLRAADGIVELRVSDNGRGIRREEIESPQSFGLMGLRERAIMWGGETIIEGVPGGGTTVSVRLPVRGEGEGG